MVLKSVSLINYSLFTSAGNYTKVQEAILHCLLKLMHPFNKLLTCSCCCRENKRDLALW